MMSNEKQIIARVVEQFVRTGFAGDEQVKVICLPDNKTSFVENIGGEGRSVMLDEYCVEKRTIWAGFSAPSQTVYLSAVKG
jgi:ribosomal protein S28E/S33